MAEIENMVRTKSSGYCGYLIRDGRLPDQKSSQIIKISHHAQAGSGFSCLRIL